MTLIPPRFSDALWRVVPAPVRNKLRSMVVKRFIRFAPAAFCAVAATQITYIICLGPANLTAGVAGFAGWLAGAAVSYVISRWAWERKGRPHLFKETLPFVAVSIGAGIILTLASKFGNGVAKDMGLDGAARVLVADMFYFAANCLTFALRFLIFHFVLFADRKAKVDTLAVVEGRAPVTDEPVQTVITHEPGRVPQPPADPARFAEAMGTARVNGMSAWANGSAGQPAVRHDEVDAAPAPERGTRR
jgi:putative flippase GtrA